LEFFMTQQFIKGVKNLLEKGSGFQAGLAGIPRYLNLHTVSSGLVAGVFNFGTLLLLIELARQVGLSHDELSSWLAAVSVAGAVLSFILGLYYQKPINGAWTIAGAVMVAEALKYYSLAEVAGASAVAGLVVMVFGLLGLVDLVARWLPLPVVMAMIGGTLLSFGLQLPQALWGAPFLAGVTLLGYFLLLRFFPQLPGVLGALFLGLVAAFFKGDLKSTTVVLALARPNLVRPEFSLPVILAVGLPLALMIMGAENMLAIGILRSQGYDKGDKGVPINAMMFLSGCATMAVAFFGGHAANIAGPKTAICATAEQVPPQGRYVSTLVEGIIFLAFGLFAPTVLSLVAVLPGALLEVVTALALIPVLSNAFRLAWQGKYQLSSTFAFVTAASGISVFGIGAPLWALIAGIGAALISGEEKATAK
jgi:benzoate membrane transport protein